MKNEDKKVPDAPDKLYVFPCHTELTCGLLDPDGKQHDGYPVWQGMANRMSADAELYINISKVWHTGKELPKSNEVDCLLDYADGMTIEVAILTLILTVHVDGSQTLAIIFSKRLFNGRTSEI